MKSGDFQRAIEALSGQEAPRVWSLIVTVFGDLAQQEGDEIAGPVLGNILSPMGVRPEAMRVALHRLRNEGWITTRKQGRTALHGLSAFGRLQSTDASTQIYGKAPPLHPEWHVLCFAPLNAGEDHQRSQAMRARGYIAIVNGVYARNSPLEHVDADAFVVQGTVSHVPNWLSAILAPGPMREGFNALSRTLGALQIDASFANSLSELQIAALRAVIVHRWRKLVLKLPQIPDIMFGDAFEGAQCRVHVLRTLDVLHRPQLSDLA